ncbi:MAG: branched-chain amino acid ABC transporter permease [Ilumatobacteraceae bacterium]
MQILLAACAFFALTGGTAHADEQTLQVRVQDASQPKKVPVEGVHVVVTDPSGTVVAEGDTDAKGVVRIQVPSDGQFTVTVDTSTLPDGLSIPEGEESRTVNVTAGLGGNANFNLGHAGPTKASKMTQLPKFVFNGLRYGLVIAIMSVGLSLIYGTTGLSNFAHGETVTIGAVMTAVASGWFTLSGARGGWGALLQIGAAAIIGILIATVFSGGLELAIWRPMRRRGIGLTSQMIVSIGLAMVVRFVIQMYYGSQPKSYAQFASQQNLNWGPIGVTPRDLTTGIIALIALFWVAYLLMYTRTGKAIRAVADNPDLASTTGINTDGIIRNVWLLGGALAGLGGVIFGLDEQVSWNMGTKILLLIFASITLGGLGRPFGALVGSLAVGVFVQLWAWWFSNFTDLKNVGALAAMILVLLFRPQGILGKKERIG